MLPSHHPESPAPRPCRRIATVATVALLVSLAGCRYGEMYDQPRYEEYEATSFFPDGLSSRPLVEGTVARADLLPFGPDVRRTYLTGRDDSGQFVAEMPFSADRGVLERGHDRYKIFCAPCHGQDGAGRGPIVIRGFSPPPKLYDPKVVNQPIGYYFDVITNGHGAMYGYAARIPVRDRWTIAAFLRALQLSRDADPSELDDLDRAALSQTVIPEATPPPALHANEGEAH